MPRQEARYPRLGEQIDRLIRGMAATKGWNMKSAMSYVSQCTHYSPDTIHRWRQGNICPSSETMEILVEIGKEDANLPREWGESMLNAAHYSDIAIVVNRIWGPKVIRTIPCNLPSRNRPYLVGRQKEIARLLELLSPNHTAPLITVDGIGGVGKTALVLEVAYRCWRTGTGEDIEPKVPLFDAIIFISAKQQYLIPEGILPSNEAKRTLRDIFREIASTLEHPEIIYKVPQEQFPFIHNILNRQHTLLIVDNLETMEDKQEIMAFLYELPRSVKVIITTRERILSFPPIRLEQLSQEEAADLIKKESDEKEVKISRDQVLTLYRSIGGIPAALVYAIGQIASGFSLETVLGRIPNANSDVARFCFEGSLKPLREKPAHHLLMAMAMFYKSPSRVALVYASGLTADLIATEEGLTQLWRLSLIREHNGRYTMLPLTREYALSELASNTSFEQQTRERWLEWYLNFTQDFGGKDWKDWYIRYDMIEEEWENLLAVFDWCAAHEQYDIVKIFWQEKHIVNFANIYGYWDDRLNWLDWLIQAAERRGDWSSGVKAMVDIGSTLTLIGQFDEADRHFKRAWERNKYVEPQIRLLLIQKIAELRIRQKDFINASTLLDQAEALLDAIASSIEEPNRTRRWADFQSRRGFLFYHMKDYNRARIWYEKMLSETKTINWDRTAIYAQNHLAYIAIHQGRLEDAEALLQTSLPANKDKRLAAFHKHVFAFFYQKKGAIDEARRLAREALTDFESLGMRQETKEMDDFLQLLEN